MTKVTDAEIQQAILDHGTQVAAAKALGIGERTIRRRVASLRKRGFCPEGGENWERSVPEGFLVSGKSELRKNGEVILEWTKSSQDKSYFLKALAEIKRSFSEELPRCPPTPSISVDDKDNLSLYILSDFHLGMLSWCEETGADWDLEIATETLMRWIRCAVETSPPAHTGIFCNLGDFLHIDNLVPATPTSGNILDADTRFQKLVHSCIQIMRYCIAVMLEKHEHVHIINAEGNHDQASSIWLREVMAVFYENEPRITVEKSPDPYYAYEWGDTSLFFHHGHKCRFNNIDRAFAAKFRQMWGRTQYSYANVGHLHHKKALESQLMEVTQWNTLAAPDAYASRGAWLSKRLAGVQTFHKKYGLTDTKIISPKMIGME